MFESMSEKIDINWSYPSDIKRNLKTSILNLRRTRKSAAELRTKHLIEKISAMNLANKSIEANTIINVEKR